MNQNNKNFVPDNTQKWLLGVIVSLLFGLNISLICGLAGTILKIYLIPYAGYLGSFLFLTGYIIFSFRYAKKILPVQLFGVCILVIGVVSSIFIYDFSFDGMRYHQMIAYSLTSGFSSWELWPDFVLRNPQQVDELIKYNPIAEEGFRVGALHLWAAMIAKISGNHEFGKFINWIIIFLSFNVVFYAGRVLKLRQFDCWWMSIVCSLNPISVSQACSFCLDGIVSSLLISAIFMLIVFCLKPTIKTGAICLLFVLPIAMAKLSGIGYAGLYLGVLILVYCIYYIRTAKQLSISIPIFIIIYLVFVNIGGALQMWPMNSTYTAPKHFNFVSYRLSFPIGIPGMSGINGLDDMNHFEMFLRSNLSKTDLAPGAFNYKWPFEVFASELEVMSSGSVEFRTGGFGPLYSLSLIIAAIVFILYAFKYYDRGFILIYFYISIFYIISGWVMPTFWARWIPHFAILPCLIMLPYHVKVGQRSRRFKLFKFTNILPSVPLIIFSLNIILVAASSYYGGIKNKLDLNHILTSLKNDNQVYEVYFKWFPSNELWLMNYGLHYIPHELDRNNGQIPIIDDEDLFIALPSVSDTVIVMRKREHLE